MTPAAVPAPGSPEALRQGCTCQFVEVMTEWLDDYDFTYDVKVSADCPLHGADPLPDLHMRPRQSRPAAAAASLKSTENARDMWNESSRRAWKAIEIILTSRECWTNGGPEIPEELSARFDMGLDDARQVVALLKGETK